MEKGQQGDRQWYALYTKPRWEKKVHALLSAKGMQSYCPLNRVRKKWSDRYKVVEEPLFKSYVFVLLDESEKKLVRQVAGVVNFVYWLGRPAIVKGAEIEKIKRFLDDFQDIRVEQLEGIVPGAKVVVTAGALMDHKGLVLAAGKKEVELLISSLGFKLVATVPRDKVSLDS